MKYILEYNEFNDLSIEEQDIKDNAILDNIFMKAPNGKKSNLTEKQWLQVRTKKFINWFGDWLNDPDKASKVIDENGEPMVLIHRSTNDFEIFDKQESIRGRVLGDGFYFSKLDTYKECGNIKYEVYLNIKTPYDLTPNKRDNVPLEKYIRIYGYTDNEYIISKLKGGGLGLVDLQSYKKDDNLIEKLGYDGVIYSKQYKVNYSNQIKSATYNNGDFDINNNSILESNSPTHSGYIR
ncbi:MAG: hypothetical protein M0R46_06740 [Candidatus Muirbacterium halophilum]|nr:hypothetical protein [Candidatus Muirbacterium halophilum]